VGHKKYNGLELDERTGARFVGRGFSRDTKTLDDGSVRHRADTPFTGQYYSDVPRLAYPCERPFSSRAISPSRS
jgi:hypothetical protein